MYNPELHLPVTVMTIVDLALIQRARLFAGMHHKGCAGMHGDRPCDAIVSPFGVPSIITDTGNPSMPTGPFEGDSVGRKVLLS